MSEMGPILFKELDSHLESAKTIFAYDFELLRRNRGVRSFEQPRPGLFQVIDMSGYEYQLIPVAVEDVECIELLLKIERDFCKAT